MQKVSLVIMGGFIACLSVPAIAQNKGATYITKEEVDTVNKQTGTDRTIRVLDIGHENFAVGIIHRGATAARGGGAGAAGGGAGAAAGAGRGAAGAGAAAGAGVGAVWAQTVVAADIEIAIAIAKALRITFSICDRWLYSKILIYSSRL